MQRQIYNLDKYTKYIQVELEDLWAYQFLPKVKENRKTYWPTRDERTCAESHIICCNKFDFVQETITINPFNTTHFGWIDAYLGDGKNGLRIHNCLVENNLYHNDYHFENIMVDYGLATDKPINFEYISYDCDKLKKNTKKGGSPRKRNRTKKYYRKNKKTKTRCKK